MRKIDDLLAQYGESHQNEFNKKVHWICVPAILFSIVGLLRSIPWPSGDSLWVNWAALAFVPVTLYYLRLSVPLAIGMVVIATSMLAFCQILLDLSMPLARVSAVLFVLAWVGQFYGHKIEGKKPSFFKDIQFLLIGPAWLLHFIYRKFGISY